MKTKSKCNLQKPSGFTLVEMLVGMVAGSLVLAGAYSLWTTHQRQGSRLEKKIDLRNDISLSSKKIQRSITLAGFGLDGAANIVKEDAVGSDSLTIYSNLGELKSDLTGDIYPGTAYIHVTNPAAFEGASYIAAKSGANGEIRKIHRVEGSIILLESPFSVGFSAAGSKVYPAMCERYFTDQEANQLMREVNGNYTVVANNIHNFQVSFRNKNGDPTEIKNEIRTVQFSFTGIVPAKEGALTSMVFSSTAIPRNIL